MNRRWGRGFTLLEMLVVLGVIVVILSVSVGVLSRLGHRNELEATALGVRSLLRRARNAAREERYGVFVHIDSRQSELRAHQKTGITQFRFEGGPTQGPPPGEDEGDGSGSGSGSGSTSGSASEEPEQAAPVPLEFELAGARGYRLTVERGLPARGRYGQGILFADDDVKGAAWGWVPDRPALSPREGIHVECWVYVGKLSETLRQRPSKEAPSAAERAGYARAGEPPRPGAERLLDYDPAEPPLYTVARKGKAWSLAVTAAYEVEIALSGLDKHKTETTFISRTRPGTLRGDHWHHLALAFDGDRARVIVDGIARQHLPRAGHEDLPVTLMRDRSPLSVSDPDPLRTFYGIVDELKLAGFIRSTRLEVPQNVALIAPSEQVAYDLLGQLDPVRHPEPFVFYLCDDERVWALLEGIVPKDDPMKSRTRADAEAAKKRRMALGASAFDRFVNALPTLDPGHVRRVVVARTGLVTD